MERPCSELSLEAVPGDIPEGGLAAAQNFTIYCKLKDIVGCRGYTLQVGTHLFPTWAHALEVADDAQCLSDWRRHFGTTLRRTVLANVMGQ